MSMTFHPKRLIEVDLPIRRISAHARREKSIRHGHIGTLHMWWARRPLATCRAVICAALSALLSGGERREAMGGRSAGAEEGVGVLDRRLAIADWRLPPPHPGSRIEDLYA
jgi:hypothetical protein